VGHKEEMSEDFSLECIAGNCSALFNDEIMNTCLNGVDERAINTAVLAGVLEMHY
jgi:hypothetical protein